MIDRDQRLDIAGATQRDAPLSVLGRIQGVGRIDLHVAIALGPRDGAKLRGDETQGLRFVEFPSHDQQCVVRLVVLPIEGLQPLDGHLLDIGTGPNRRVPVVVPEVGGGHRPLFENAARIVLTQLELVPHHGEFGLEIFLGHVTVNHPVGFEIERPGQVAVGRREGLEVVGAIEPGRSVGIGPVLGQLLRNVAVPWGALEEHVLEEMSHSGLPVSLIPGANHVCDVDCHGGLRWIGKQQEPEAIGQAVFGDAFDARPLDGADGGAGRLSSGGLRLGRCLLREGRNCGPTECDDDQRHADALGKDAHGISTEIAVHRDTAGNSMNIRELQPFGFTPALDWLAGRYMA